MVPDEAVAVEAAVLVVAVVDAAFVVLLVVEVPPAAAAEVEPEVESDPEPLHEKT